MKKFLTQFARYTSRQGFFKGINILLKFRKTSGLIKVTPLEANTNVWLRPKTSDIPTFDEVFVARQYEFDYGFIPSTIIDCGANIGLATVFFKNKFPNSTIISVEPEKSNYEMLEKNVSNYKDIHCINAGIWNKEIALKGSEKYGSEKWMFSVEEASETDLDTMAAISINAILDKYNINEIGILKIDIEGAELELFSNNTENWLGKTKCIVIELHDRMRKGTGNAFFRIMSLYDFSYYQNGVNLFCINNSVK